jgi:hypothetical protein
MRGGLCFVTLELRPDNYKISTRQLFWLDLQSELSARITKTGRLIKYKQPGRRALQLAIARTLRYPWGWIRGEPVDVCRVLDARKGLRLFSTHGEFFRKSNTKTV